MDEVQKNLARVVGRLEQKVMQLEAEIKRKKTYEVKLLQCLSDPDRFVMSMDAIQKRVDELGNRLQSFINRECVLTEVSRYVQRLGSADLIVHFHLKLMDAYNWGDEFWEQKGNRELTTKQWFDKIMEVEKPTTDEVTADGRE